MSVIDPTTEAKMEGLKHNPQILNVPGVINIRDVGRYPSDSSPGKIVNPMHVIRSGELSRITEDGKAVLREIGVKKIFDLRGTLEIEMWKTPPPIIEGIDIQNVGVPDRYLVSADGTLNRQALIERLKAYETDELNTHIKSYSVMLEDFAPSYGIILKYMVNNPRDSVIFHCTAGKDRTGVFTCVLLMILGVSDSVIAQDYSLTEICLLPIVPMLTERLQRTKEYADNMQGTMNMGSSREITMLTLINHIRETFGSAEEYLTSKAGLTAEELGRIKTFMLVPAEEGKAKPDLSE